jgi:hypothetical protein
MRGVIAIGALRAWRRHAIEAQLDPLMLACKIHRRASRRSRGGPRAPICFI